MAGELEKSLRSRNAELEKELALRVSDLKQKNRELEIEKASEKVRVCALAMKQPDDMLDICRVMCGQLEQLGIADIRNVQTAIIYIENGIYINYEYYRLYKKTFVTEVDYSHPIQADFVEKMLTPGAQLHVSLEGKELEDWFEYQKNTNQFADPHLAEASSLNYYWFSIGPVALGISLYAPLSPDGINLFKRFLNVFRLAYQRYKDIELALGQAKEARIEASLERVRAKAMAMHSSEDLSQTVNAFFKELKALGITPIRCGVGQIDEETRTTSLTTTTSFRQGDSFDVIGKLKQTGHPVLDGIYDHWVLQEEYHPVLKGPDIKAYYDVTKSQIAYPDYSEEVTQYGNNFYFKEGFVFAWTENKLSEEELKIFRRFTSVLSLTYRRYIDLKEAEEQARESLIELSLERIRAKTMAMHQSAELADAALLLFQQLQQLGLSFFRTGFYIWRIGTDLVDGWTSNGGLDGILPPVVLPFKEDDGHRGIYESALNGELTYEQVLGGDELMKHYEWLMSQPTTPMTMEAFKDAGIALPGTQYKYAAIFKGGYLLVMAAEPQPDASNLLKRFAKVFEQTYTRFLDLQKAETQARESQIQLALERVRAKTMAMQKSDELLETSQVLFHQLRDLGETADQISIAIVNEDERVFNLFATIYGTQMVRMVKISLDEPFTMGKIYKNWKAKKRSFAVEIGGEELRKYNIARNANSDNNYYNEDVGAEDRWIINAASFSQGVLSFSSSKEPTREATQLLERFAQVFENTYTRFLDLQKAEAQARESKIEAALERVRSRTMGMQKSEELKEVIRVVYDQFVHLDIHVEHTGFIVDYKERDDMHIWLADPLAIPFEVTIPYFDSAHFNSFNEAKEKGIDFFANTLGFEEKNKFYQDLFKLIPGIPEETKEFYFNSPGLAISTVLLDNVGLYIENFLGTPYSDEENKTLMRFGKVFQQTYTRFLDLQKAEAQAREARIEVSLERVRSRAMAMHKTDELLDAAELLYKELTGLGISSMAVTYSLIDKEEKSALYYSINPVDGKVNPVPMALPHTETQVMRSILASWKKKDISHLIELDEKATLQHQTYIGEVILAFFKKHNVNIPFSMEAFLEVSPKKAVIYTFNFTQGYIFIIGSARLTGMQEEIVLRFTKVFELTYRRFLDLKQAEEQARESQVQLALERVRARTMAMQHSDELSETVFILFQQFKNLGENPDQATIGIINEEEHVIEYWVTMHGNQTNRVFRFSIDEPDVTLKIYKGWKEEKKSIVIDLAGKALYDFSAYRAGMGGAPAKKGEKRRIINVAFFSKGLINVQSNEERSEQSLRLLERFAAVFDGTYTRFLDLKHAEAQAREARIEAALERVRSKTMAMHNSADVGNTVTAMFDELVKLGIETNRCGILIGDETTQMEVWTAKSNPDSEATLIIGRLDMLIHPLLEGINSAWKNKESTFEYLMDGDNLKDYYRAINNANFYPVQFDINSLPKKEIHTDFFFADGALFAFTRDPVPAEAVQIFKRFAGVFGQTYRRYLDLQKAENQAREAKIEAALDRVRSKTMAMHNSGDIGDTVSVMFEQLVNLGVETTVRCGVAILYDTKHMEVWTASSAEDSNVSLIIGRLDMTIHPMLEKMHQAWQNKETSFSYELAGEDIKDYYKAIIASPGYHFNHTLESIPNQQINNVFFFPEGALFAFTIEPFSAEATQLFKRFAGVFGLTYRRFLDLQTAETNARESQIEAALERVRGRAMAMHNSNDLSSAASMVFTEVRKLGIVPIRCGVGLLNKDSRKGLLYSATTSNNNDALALIGWVELSGHPVLERIYQSWLDHENYFPVLNGKQLKTYYESLLSGLQLPSVPDWAKGAKQYGHFLQFPEGCLYAWSEKPYNDTEIKILDRFKGVISLTFRRYIELQKSEANARDAIREASLDRVRAEIASMRTTNDLEKITPLVWNELTTLGVPFIRCGVFIVDEAAELVHYYLSTPDGNALASFKLPFEAPGIGQNVLLNWRAKQVFKIHWNEAEFTAYTKNLVEQGAIKSEEKYVTAHPPTKLDLHFFPFLQGMLYVGNIAQLGNDEMILVQSLADAFSTAYARYEDFNKLEAAKQQVDNTLTELKAAQTKLIQSEKMASLGELTAGIAHEIQNPLNFVNNFSEVNQEMIEELQEELRSGNIEEALALAADIKQNEEKINHHGKRADGIVKGMLQHSRISSGEKQLTNINVLADEFMRLSYHGLRAKDKSFNSEMVTDFDPELPKISVIAQDIGRVLLNLFNNAFYAVSEKRKIADANYKAKVTATTSSENGQLVIKVLDNGNGIPEAIKDKIMQPFFTTKPTGEGTGLGLSLSYDIIVKGHGGSMQVNSVEGEGSEFIIQLPI